MARTGPFSPGVLVGCDCVTCIRRNGGKSAWTLCEIDRFSTIARIISHLFQVVSSLKCGTILHKLKSPTF